MRKLLDLTSLGIAPGMPGLTPAAGRYLAEAAAVCLAECGHEEEVELTVRGWDSSVYRVRRPSVDEQTRRTYRDLQESTEQGACGVAILLVRELRGLQLIERSRKGTGFDYWIGEPEHRPFRLTERLEVSGILRGSEADVDKRVARKCRQTMQSDETQLSAVVVVVEFSKPLAKVVKR